MVSENVTIHFRVKRKLKEEAEELFKELGVNMTDAMVAFLTNCVQTDSIPFLMTRYQKPGAPTRLELQAEREEHMHLLQLLDRRIEAIEKKEKYRKSLHNPFISTEVRMDMAKYYLREDLFFTEEELEEYTMNYYKEHYDLRDVEWGDSFDPSDAVTIETVAAGTADDQAAVPSADPPIAS